MICPKKLHIVKDCPFKPIKLFILDGKIQIKTNNDLIFLFVIVEYQKNTNNVNIMTKRTQNDHHSTLLNII